jgi:hypothetical protein
LSFPYLRHPLVLLSLVLTLLNDQYLKYQYPGFLTGKLSDFAGLFYFPFFLYAVSVFLRHPNQQHSQISLRGFAVCLVVTEILFVLLKYTALRAEFVQLFSWYFFKIEITPDISDMWALTVHMPAFILARQYRLTPN